MNQEDVITVEQHPQLCSSFEETKSLTINYVKVRVPACEMENKSDLWCSGDSWRKVRAPKKQWCLETEADPTRPLPSYIKPCLGPRGFSLKCCFSGFRNGFFPCAVQTHPNIVLGLKREVLSSNKEWGLDLVGHEACANSEVLQI